MDMSNSLELIGLFCLLTVLNLAITTSVLNSGVGPAAGHGVRVQVMDKLRSNQNSLKLYYSANLKHVGQNYRIGPSFVIINMSLYIVYIVTFLKFLVLLAYTIIILYIFVKKNATNFQSEAFKSRNITYALHCQ